MLRASALWILTALMWTSSAEASTLNKCIDAKGQVTYSNLPCRNAQEVRTVEIDPAPLPDPVRTQPAKAKPGQAAPIQDHPAKSTAIKSTTQNTASKAASRTSARQCDTLTDKLGRVFDKMDQARRKGYTLEQMEKWNLEVKDLERQKQQSGCF